MPKALGKKAINKTAVTILLFIAGTELYTAFKGLFSTFFNF